MRNLLLIVLLALQGCSHEAQKNNLLLQSPNGKLKVILRVYRDYLTYQLQWQGNTITQPAVIKLDIDQEQLQELDPCDTILYTRDTVFQLPVAIRRKAIRDHFNGLTVKFRQPLALEARAYNDGFAYRWVGNIPGQVFVAGETFEFKPGKDATIFYTPAKNKGSKSLYGWYTFMMANLRSLLQNKLVGSVESDFEVKSEKRNFFEISEPTLIQLPLFAEANGTYLCMAEASVVDYPGALVRRKNQQFSTTFQKYPLELFRDSAFGKELERVKANSKYIAHTTGKRSWPWRTIIIGQHPTDIASSEMVRKLAYTKHIPGNYNWIQPGQVTDEWAVDINLHGVDFVAGQNTRSYQYYIDFAKRFGIEYVMLDDGWCINASLKHLNPAINLDSLSQYAGERGIKLGLWVSAFELDKDLDRNLQWLKHKGASLLLVDFVRRTDQLAWNLHERIAKAANKYHLLINMHGVAPPAGFEMQYPNVISWEGLLASEWNGWSELATPDHHVTLPFTRMVAGSMDYEPGILEHGNQKLFRPISAKPMSQGTRAHNLAMYINFDNPLQYFIGNPSQGNKEPAYMEFLGGIPTTWDETIILDGKPGEYIVTARQKDSVWYIGAMTNWVTRDLQIDLSKLRLKHYNLQGIEDGLNADRYAADYRIVEKKNITDKLLTVRLASGGGGVWKLY